MKNISIFFLALILGVTSVLGWRFWQTHQQKIEFKPQMSDFQLQPPTQSLRGTITSLTGEVKKQSAHDTEPSQVDLSTPLQEADTVFTGKQSQTTWQVGRDVQINMAEKSEVVLSNTTLAQFLFLQKSGTATYHFLDNTSGSTLSIRAGNSLYQIQAQSDPGLPATEVQIQVTETGVSFSQLHGNGTLARLDKDNNTKVFQIKEKQKVFATKTETVIR